MVRGLGIFQQHFAHATDHFVLIGGVAVQLLLEEAGFRARATKDIDMVFRVEVINPDFIASLQSFVERGGYATKKNVTGGERELFRFLKPADPAFPAMLEIFAGKPGSLTLFENQVAIPIGAGEDLLSLSALLIEEGYYEHLSNNTQVLAGLPIANAGCLILLKARAWLDLTQRKAEGEKVDSKNIKKHRDDAFKLSQLLPIDATEAIDLRLLADFHAFLDRFPPDSDEWVAIAATANSARLPLPPPRELLADLRSYFIGRTE